MYKPQSHAQRPPAHSVPAAMDCDGMNMKLFMQLFSQKEGEAMHDVDPLQTTLADLTSLRLKFSERKDMGVRDHMLTTQGQRA